jgi:hypothetical protein
MGTISSGFMMKRTFDISEDGLSSEMAIVDTFTKLIFGEESEYSDGELRIIQALRQVEDHVSVDDHRDMGVFLRALGVREMIGLVSRVRKGLAGGVPHKPISGHGYQSFGLRGIR